ncbi:MAG TPA: hypothetical protein VGJ70_04620 [Solirubrobacteraceae bacterium]|jgi:hypothetical protein
MRLLVLAPRVIGADDVRAALPNDDLTGAQVLVVTPAHGESAVAFWLGDVDQAIAEAEGGAQRTAESLREAGARARGTVGDDDPLLALHDALASYPADRIVVFDDGLAAEARERFDIPVTHGHLRT